MDMPILSGPALPPRDGRAPRQLMILLHGVGADGNDLISLAPLYQSVLPGARIVSPNAPFPFDMAPFGHQWFSLQNFGPETRSTGVRQAAPILARFIGDELARTGLGADKLVLMGFSQGAMMALYVGLRWPQPLAGIIAHSGMLVAPEALPGEIRCKPPVLLTHGEIDEVLPATALPHAEDILAATGVPVEAHLMRGLGHGIDEPTIRLDLDFLARLFAPGG